MTSSNSVFLISSRKDFVAEAESVARRAGNIDVCGVTEFANGATAPAGAEALRAGTASAVLVDLDSGGQEAFSTLSELCSQVPEALVLVASSDQSPDLILRAMRAGAADFLSLPLDSGSLADALTRAMRRMAHEPAATGRQGRVISFMNSKGGCGATSVSLNLAAALATRPGAKGRAVVVVDMEYPGGDMSAMLRINPSYSIADVAANIHRLDMDLLGSMTHRHESGFHFLASSAEGDGAMTHPPLSPEDMSAIVAFLRDNFDDVILAGGTMGDVDMAAISQANIVHLVTTLDFLALRRTQQTSAALKQYGVPGDSLRVVINRLDKNTELSLGDARQALDAPIVWSIPNDPRSAERAVNEGTPFVMAGKSRLHAAFEQYVSALEGSEENGTDRSGIGGLFRRLVPRRAGAAS